jgi:hypothetical protein
MSAIICASQVSAQRRVLLAAAALAAAGLVQAHPAAKD